MAVLDGASFLSAIALFTCAGAVPLRKNMRLFLKLLRALSVLCTFVGVTWLMMLPMNEYSRRTYISENALLPGQVHAYFSGSDQNVFRAYQKEIAAFGNETSTVAGNSAAVDSLVAMFRASGLKAGKQRYSYKSAGKVHSGENAYAILHAPRGDATEAIVLCAALRNVDEVLNDGGVGLVMALSRYLKRWSLWSKDIIFLVTGDARAGPQAWVDAYHDKHNLANVESLPLKSGAIQGVLVVDYPYTKPMFDSLHIVYDGINGQLPNLDLINTAVEVSTKQMNMRTTLQEMWSHSDSYGDRLKTMLRGMVNQGVGHASGPHSSFIPYHIDAITLQPVGEGWNDEMKLGRTIEGVFRSLNNLLEHFHQSFFFYLLMESRRFVSIGTYLPSAMLVAVGFTLTAIRLWIDSGMKPPSQYGAAGDADVGEDDADVGEDDEDVDVDGEDHDEGDDEKARLLKAQGGSSRKRSVSPSASSYSENSRRRLFIPLAIVITAHALGAAPLTAFNTLDRANLSIGFQVFSALSYISPFLFAGALVFSVPENSRLITFQLTRSFSLLLLGMFLAALATLNFSLSFLIGLFSYPLGLAQPLPKRKPLAFVVMLWVLCAGPSSVLLGVATHWNLSVEEILVEAAFGWSVWGMWTQVVVWCVWYPAWLVGATVLAVSFFVDDLPLVDETPQQEYHQEQPWDALLKEKKSKGSVRGSKKKGSIRRK